MLRTFRAFRGTIAVALYLFTIFWLPRDIQDSGEAAQPWRRMLVMIDQYNALWLAVVLLGGWIVWTDLRPFYHRWRQKPADLVIAKKIYLESAPVETDKGTRADGMFCNKIFVIVRNNRADKLTLRRVSARFYLFGAPRLLKTNAGAYEIDIRHGESAFFEIGRGLSHHLAGVPLLKPVSYPSDKIGTARDNLSTGCPMITAAPDDPEPFNIAFPKQLPEVMHAIATVAITADDVASEVVHLRMDARKLPDVDEAFVILGPEEMADDRHS